MTGDWSVSPEHDRVLLFCREPVLGRVKTRLASGVGDAAALELYTAFLRDCLASALELAVPVTLAHTPDSDPGWFERELSHPDVTLLPQRGADLGARMAAALEWAWGAGAERAVIFGTDSPTVPISARRKAILALDRAPVVLAPDAGGGYYALGARKGTPLDWLADITWGGADVYEVTRRELDEHGIRVALAPLWYDVDVPEDLAELRRTFDYEQAYPAPHTRAALAAMAEA